MNKSSQRNIDFAPRVRLLRNANRCIVALALSSQLASIAFSQNGDAPVGSASAPSAVERANRPFSAPAMSAPSIDPKLFTTVDVGAKIPNYTPGKQWGTQGAPLTEMQNPIPAELSLKAYSTPEQFQMDLWAKEKNENWSQASGENSILAGLQGKPIAMNWDERGRLWICETIDYPNELQSPGQGRDRIKICEDTDNDGHADKFTVFAEHLSIPSTLVCVRGGVIVQDGQSTIYLKDVDGDDQADFKQILITGWALGDTHGGVSNFQFGPDNWIWSMQGYNNSTPVINGEKQMGFRQGFWRFKLKQAESNSTSPAFAISSETKNASNNATERFDDHTLRVEALEFIRATNNNTWGLGFSEEGYVFGSTANNCPSVHMPIPNRYYDKVAGWSPKTLEKISPDAKFQPIDDHIRQVDVHGGYTAAAGSALYTARNYPQSWWNRIQMVCEPTGHLVGAFVLEKSGAEYKSKNIFNVVASIDDWSAPIMAEVGPDGNVWVLDWYNYIVQHNPTPNGFKTGKGAAYESDLRDKRFARIYRLLYQPESEKSRASHSRDLSQSTDSSLVETLKDSNFFWRRTAQRLLVERGVSNPQTLNQLVSLVDIQETDSIGLAPCALHAIWTLAGLADSGNESAAKALRVACSKGMKHPSSPVRSAAATYCLDDQIDTILDLNLLKDSDPRVQLSCLLRLADKPSHPRLKGDLFAKLLLNSESLTQDRTLLDAWTSAASQSAISTLVALTHDSALNHKSELSSAVGILAEHIARSNPGPQDVEALLEMAPLSDLTIAACKGLAKGWPKDLTLKTSDAAQKKFRDSFLAESTPMECKAAILSVAEKWSIGGLEQSVAAIQKELFDIALDPKNAMDARTQSWEQAIRLAPSSPRVLVAVAELLTPQLDPEMGSKALEALQQSQVEGLASQLLKTRLNLSPSLSSSTIRLLLSRADMTLQLLDAIEKGEAQLSELQLDQRQAILNHPNKEIASRANELTKSRGAMLDSNRQKLVESWKPVCEMPGDLQNGLATYKKHCAQCHKHGELGTAIGPNLTGMAVHPKEEILMNVLDPSRSVENNFRTYQILTVDGLVLNGMLAGESANSIRLIDTQGKEQQVLRSDIEQIKASTKSLMPEGFESSITKQEMADLLTFLGNRGRYTPLTLSSAATISNLKGVPGMRNAPPEKIELPAYGHIDFEGVPFELQDPQEGRMANVIALQSSGGRFPTSLPSAATVLCSGAVSEIHLLATVLPFGPPSRGESACLVVRCLFEDGTTETHELYEGKDIASIRDKNETSNSKLAIDANGKHIRYTHIQLKDRKPLKSIEFAKGADLSIPLVFAVTVESQSDSHD